MLPDRPVPRRWCHAWAIILLFLVSCSASARCEVTVQGNAAALRIDARHASLPEVLHALETNFKVRHDALVALDEVIVSGTYAGKLEDVLRRVLAGLNYVIKTEQGALEVIIIGRPGANPGNSESATPAPPTNTNPAAQWRRAAAQRL